MKIFLRFLVLMASAALIGTGLQTAAADAPSTQPMDSNKTWFVDAACEYAVAMWKATGGPMRDFVEISSHRSLRLHIETMKLVEMDESVGVPYCAADGLAGRFVEFQSPRMDTDGDGNFETSLETKRAYLVTVGGFTPRDKPYRVQFKAIAPNGRTIVAQTLVYVESNYGIRVNGGSKFTSSSKVSLRIVPAPGATAVKISNDRDFRTKVKTVPVGIDPFSVRWSVGKSSSTTKRVFIRFVDSSTTTKYSTSIKMDTKKPVVNKLSVRNNSRYTIIKVSAKDDRSGVKHYQASSKGKRSAAPVKKYSKSFKMVRSSKPVHLRVRDGAGNWSKWASVRPTS